MADGLTVPTVGVNAFATGAPIIDKVNNKVYDTVNELKTYVY